MAEPMSSVGAGPKAQPTASVQPVSPADINPASPTTAQSPDPCRPVKHRPFSNVTNVSYDPTSPQPHSSAPPNFISRFWAQRNPASRHIPNTTDEKIATSATVTPDDVSELEDLETHWHMISEQAQRKLGKDWKPTWQLRDLLVQGLKDWLVVVILLVALWAEIYALSKKAVLSKNMKNLHNFLNVGLSLTIGIAIVTGLKRMMQNMRWWFLSLKKRTPYEVSLILCIDSLRECCKIIWHYPKGMAHVCILWLVINIGMQIAIATQGLTLTMDGGAKIALTKPGNVSYAPMRKIEGIETGLGKGTDIDFDAQCFLANSYGTAGLTFKYATIDQVPEPKTLYTSPTDSYTYFEGTQYDDDTTHAYYQYVFVEANPDLLNEEGVAPGVEKDDALPIMIYTHRKINVTATCTPFTVSDGGNGWAENGTILVNINGDGDQMNVQTPINRGVGTTQYWVDNATDSIGCGDGCNNIHVFESSDTMPWYYECEVTVGRISQTATEDQQISDSVRRIAAQAIALQGFTFFKTPEEEEAWDGVPGGVQFQAYPAKSYWGYPMKGSGLGMAAQVAEFATLTIATTALTNRPNTTIGDQPQRGEALSVEWENLYLILGLIAGVQLFFMIITSLVANLVFIKDGNPLSIARFLRPLVDRLGPAGNTADGKQIAKALDEDHTMIVYSVRHPQQHQRHHLDLGVQRRLRAFPRGRYD